jgi:Cu-Zn family superoxide dismutase
MKTGTMLRPSGWHRTRLGIIAVGAFIAASLTLGGPATAATGLRTAGPLRDLAPSAANPTDGAYAQVAATGSGASTTVYLVINGLSPAAAGEVHGAHVHTGPCIAGDGTSAGPHFNIGGPASATTEVWLDFTIQPNGAGYASTTVPFVIPPGGAKSVVIHATPTQPGGGAGARIACLPVLF